ncbi:sensor histidine kinase [Lachnospiraceae bacterium ASD4241]|uniref:Sensor histidine kinase n=2 Tax=Diplocloster modestus TaxID=2850322 RepID=A0ABS6K520_9FIRM|nr:sensor histidine kinase [Diplocloster modestus]
MTLKRIQFKKIRYKMLFAVLILMILSLSFVAVIAQYQAQKKIREQSLRTTVSLMQVGVENMETSYDQLSNLFLSIYLNENFQYFLQQRSNASFSGSRSYFEVLKSVFLSCISSRSDVYSIIYVDKKGYLTYTTRDEAGHYQFYEDVLLPEEYMELIKNRSDWNQNQILIPTHKHMPLRNNAHPSDVYAIARNIINTQYHFEEEGTMFITVDLSRIKHLAEMMKPDPSARTVICDANNCVIYDTAQQLTGIHLPDDLKPPAGTENSAWDLEWKEERYVGIFQKAEEMDCSIIMLIPDSVYAADALSVSTGIMLAAVIIILVAVVITVYVSGTISKPIEQLAAVMKTSGIKNLNNRVEINGQDETAQIGQTFNSLMDNLKNSIEKEYLMAIKQRDTIIKALQEQINPHFLYNVLQSISSMAALHGISDVVTMSNALGNILRYNIRGSDFRATLREEADHVENYLAIQKIRFGSRLDYQIFIPEYLMNEQIPRVTLQPMVENAIVHGFADKTETGHIYVTAYMRESCLIIEVMDDGNGIEKGSLKNLQNELSVPDITMLTPAEHIGLSNLNARLKLLFKNARLEIDSDVHEGTVIRVIVFMEE